MSAHDIQERFQVAIDRMVTGGGEVGLQVAVLHGGRVAVDAVSGLSDGRGGSAVAPDTLFFAASTAKGIASAVAHVAVAVMRNRFGAPGLTALTEVDRIVADAFPVPRRSDRSSMN